MLRRAVLSSRASPCSSSPLAATRIPARLSIRNYIAKPRPLKRKQIQPIAPAKPSPKPRPERVADPRSSSWRPRSPDDFKFIVGNGDNYILDPAEVHRIYNAFHKAEPGSYHRTGTTEWLPEFVKENGIKPRDLHEVALRSSGLGPLTKAEFEFQYRMFDSASDLGHVPATLHIIRTVLFGKDPEILPRFRPRAYARFKTLVAEGRNPDALTLQGKIHALRGETELAEEFFRRAQDVAAQSDAGFQWENLCHLELAALHEARGAREEACRAYRALADAQDAEGCYYLATLDVRMPGPARLVPEDEARELLTRAAMAGYPPASTALADAETGRFQRAVAEGDEDAAARCLLDAQEWRNLAAAWKVRDPKDYHVY